MPSLELEAVGTRVQLYHPGLQANAAFLMITGIKKMLTEDMPSYVLQLECGLLGNAMSTE